MDIDAIAFDAFGTLFDLGDLKDAVTTKLLPAMLFITAAGRFVTFPELAERVLGRGAAEKLSSLDAFPDASEGLAALQGTAPLAVLSNGTQDGIRSLVRRAGIEDRFDHLLTADQAGRYKPSPELYGLAPEAFGIDIDRILLVSGNEWDLVGARWSGLQTAWLARGRSLSQFVESEPDLVVENIVELARTLR